MQNQGNLPSIFLYFLLITVKIFRTRGDGQRELYPGLALVPRGRGGGEELGGCQPPAADHAGGPRDRALCQHGGQG
jgi:hypothetical protein